MKSNVRGLQALCDVSTSHKSSHIKTNKKEHPHCASFALLRHGFGGHFIGPRLLRFLCVDLFALVTTLKHSFALSASFLAWNVGVQCPHATYKMSAKAMCREPPPHEICFGLYFSSKDTFTMRSCGLRLRLPVYVKNSCPVDAILAKFLSCSEMLSGALSES